MSLIGKKYTYRYNNNIYQVIQEYTSVKGNLWYWVVSVPDRHGPFSVSLEALEEDYLLVEDKFQVGKKYYGQSDPEGRFVYETVYADETYGVLKRLGSDTPDPQKPFAVKHDYLKSNNSGGGWLPLES